MTIKSRKGRNWLLDTLSIVLPLLGVGFVIQRIWVTGATTLADYGISRGIIVTLAGGAIYAAGNLLLVLAWQMLLKWFGEADAVWGKSVAIYGSTQIAKYIPGNIFHLPSRHLKGFQNGFQHAPLLGAAAFEMIGLLVAASLVSLAGFLAGIRTAISIISIAAVLCITLVSPIILRYLVTHINPLKRIQLPPGTGLDLTKRLLPIWSIYLLFFFVANSIFFAIVRQVSGPGFTVPIPVAYATFTVSWLAGFITPGAPAGIGVREGVIILILSRYIGEPASITISILARFVTFSGDLLFYFVGLWYSSRHNDRTRGIKTTDNHK